MKDHFDYRKTFIRNGVYLSSIIFVIFFVYYYVHQEDHFYYWDFNGYYLAWKHLGRLLSESPQNFIIEILRSIRNSDYNYSIIIPLLPFNYIFSGTRLGYILSIFVIYFIPISFLFAKASSIILLKDSTTKLGFNIFFFLFCLFFWPFWGVIFRGFPDIASLIFILICLILCFKKDLSVQISLNYIIIIGVSFWLIFLFRRWYAYTLVSMGLSLPIFNYLLHNNSFNLKKICNLLINFFSSFVIASSLMVLSQYNLFKRILTTDYSHIYSAYHYSFQTSIFSFVNHVGLAFVVLAILLFFISLKFLDRQEKILSIFYIFNFSFTFYIFTRTQGPRMQHLLPLELWFLFLVVLSVFVLISLIKSTALRYIVMAILVAINFCVLIASSTRVVLPEQVQSIMPVKRDPLKLRNLDGYKSLLTEIKNLIKDNNKVSVLSSSAILNDEILNSLSFSELTKNIQRVSHVDLRDKFNVNIFSSKYLIVTDPVQTHLPRGTQNVISIPVREILERTTIGKAYRQLGHPYTLENGVKAFIFEKVQPIDETDFSNFLNKFYSIYPSWRKDYNDPLLHVFSTSLVKLGDKWGRYYFNGSGKIEVHPGDNSPTIIRLKLHDINSLKFTSINTNCNRDDPILIRIRSNDNDSGFIALPKGSSISLNVQPWKDKMSELIISKNKSSGCDGLEISSLP